MDEPLLDPVREPPRVEPVLEPSAAVVVDAHVEIMRRNASEIHVVALGDSINRRLATATDACAS
jgi:hypothetical protein